MRPTTAPFANTSKSFVLPFTGRAGGRCAFEHEIILFHRVTVCDWQLGGFAVDPPIGSTASMGDSSQVNQLVQAMAGFGGGAPADISNTAPLGPDTSQKTLLTSPQHA